jgi:hypothetical protein
MEARSGNACRKAYKRLGAMFWPDYCAFLPPLSFFSSFLPSIYSSRVVLRPDVLLVGAGRTHPINPIWAVIGVPCRDEWSVHPSFPP